MSIVNPGDVVELFTRKSIPPKVKRIILVAQTGTTFLGVFINTIQNTNFNTNQVIQDLHPELKKEGRSYLDYDSFIDCSCPFEFEIDEIINSLRRDINHLKGTLSSADLEFIRGKVKNSYTADRDLRKKYFGEDAVPPRRPRIVKKVKPMQG